MSNILIYLKVPQYEKEWCEFHFGSPCVFPSGTSLNKVIRHFMKKRPDNVPPETQQPGEMAVCLMGSQSKKPEVYNYVGKHGKKAIAEDIDLVFSLQMWEDLNKQELRRLQVSQLVLDWMENNGISMQGNNYENLRMKFQRIKDSYRKSGVNISRGYKHEFRNSKKK